MLRLTFLGGIHPDDGKAMSKDRPIREVLPKGELVYPLSQHIGAPAKAIVAKGDRVLAGQKIAEAGGLYLQIFLLRYQERLKRSSQDLGWAETCRNLLLLKTMDCMKKWNFRLNENFRMFPEKRSLISSRRPALSAWVVPDFRHMSNICPKIPRRSTTSLSIVRSVSLI